MQKREYVTIAIHFVVGKRPEQLDYVSFNQDTILSKAKVLDVYQYLNKQAKRASPILQFSISIR